MSIYIYVFTNNIIKGSCKFCVRINEIQTYSFTSERHFGKHVSPVIKRTVLSENNLFLRIQKFSKDGTRKMILNQLFVAIFCLRKIQATPFWSN